MKRISRFDIYQNQLKELKQADAELGCIPTNIAAALQAYDVRDATENGIQMAYRYAISFEKIKSGVLGKLEEMIDQNISSRFELEHQAGIESYDDWWQKLTDCISKKDAPVIFSYNVNGSCHVVTAVGYDDEKLEIYDPWPGNPKEILPVLASDLKKKWESGKLYGEILAVRRKQSQSVPKPVPEVSGRMEQEARLALLEYFGSLAQHWATVALAAAVAFFSVVQLRDTINNDSILTFALVLVAAEGIFSFMRMIVHGKYCELALDSEVKAMGAGVLANQMLHGMAHNLRTRWIFYRFLDKIGRLKGWLYWTVISILVAFYAAVSPPFFPITSMEGLFMGLLGRPYVIIALGMLIVVACVLLIWLISKIPFEGLVEQKRPEKDGN
jgi:hypothetical protein